MDVEFAAQFLQIANAPEGGPLRPGTLDALAALDAAGLVSSDDGRALSEAWSLQQALSQFMKAALDETAGADDEPDAFKTMLARAGGAEDFEALRLKLEAARARARAAFDKTLA